MTERFLPDKAIDLIDEACANIKVEIESMPFELDEVTRKIMQLEIEKVALKQEKDENSKQRLIKLEDELAILKSDEQKLRIKWQEEKKLISDAKKLKNKFFSNIPT